MSLTYYIYETDTTLEDIKTKTSIIVDTSERGSIRFMKEDTYGFPFFSDDGILRKVKFYCKNNPEPIMTELYYKRHIKFLNEWALSDYIELLQEDRDFSEYLNEVTKGYFK